MVDFASQLVREARLRAGLTQRALADRAGTTQSAIARIEAGDTSPSLASVQRLIRLCGLDLEVAIVEHDGSDMAQADRLVVLTPAERMERAMRTAKRLRAIKGRAQHVR